MIIIYDNKLPFSFRSKLPLAFIRIINYDCFIVQATFIIILKYDRNIFIAQATDKHKSGTVNFAIASIFA